MQIIDNFVDVEDLDKLLKIMDGLDFPWFYRESSSYESGKDKVPQFAHIFYTDNKINSYYFELILPWLRKFEDVTEYKIKRIHRIKANMLLDQNHKESDIKISIHRDITEGKDYDHYVSLLYYIDDADGDTLIYKGKEVIKKVSPKRNRAFIFKSNTLHNATPPKKQHTRRVINFVLELES
jgi:hypothetical protein